MAEWEVGTANWNSVPFLNLTSQQEEEEEGTEEEEGGLEKKGWIESVDWEEMSTGGKKKSKRRIFFSTLRSL